MTTPTHAVPKPRVRLVMVTSDNHNKYYEMQDNSDGTFTVQYGRVGSRGMDRCYPIREWERLYCAKVRKGYTDVTPFYVTKGRSTHREIEDVHVRRLVRTLQHYASLSVRDNYVVAAHEVTAKQIDEAQALLDEIVALFQAGAPAERINRTLLALYTVIPRRMAQVEDHLIDEETLETEKEQIERNLAEEQATLDVMAGQVRMAAQAREQQSEACTVLETMGLDVSPVDNPGEIAVIKEKMGEHVDAFRAAYAVRNRRTQADFERTAAETKRPQCRLLWHGSRNENWLSILEAGLVLHPANAVVNGKMFGYGLYFADRCQKSLGYTSLRGTHWGRGTDRRGFLGLFDVHVGRALHLKQHHPWCYALTRDSLRKRGLLGRDYDSVFAERGRSLLNNEYIVYDPSQCTVRYLVEVSH